METILIVDDDATNIELLAFILEDEYKIMTAESGEMAIEIALTHTPELILLDVQMPGLDGYQTCLKLKENNVTKNCPVIFVSANDSEEETKKGYEVGAVDYVVKPINAKEIRDKVRLNIAKNSLEAQDEGPIISEMLDGDPKITQLVKNLVDELPSWLEAIKQSFQDKNWVETKRNMHVLKGTAGSFGFPAVSTLVARMENELKEERYDEFNLSSEELSVLILRVVKGKPE